MGSFLVCSSPLYGHVAPMVAIGRHLNQRGHRVRMMTGTRYTEAVLGAGLEFVPLPAAIDFDDRDLESAFPEAYGKKGLAGAKIGLSSVFIAPIEHQFRALQEVIRNEAADAVLVDVMFLGALPLLLQAGPRPPVLAIGITPLLRSSIVSRVLFQGIQRQVRRITEDLANRRPPKDWLDWAQLADRCLQLATREFENPRRRVPPNTAFVGPVLSHYLTDFHEPAWWPELQQGRPVVHVSQGTLDNTDPSELITPTLDGLAHDNLLVVATMGGRPITHLPGPLPTNARVESFVPHDKVLPYVDVMVTNGGYGGVQSALAHGVPLVVAGGTADKPEVAALVARSGAGINLRTGKPTSEAVAAAVRRILAEPGYKDAAARLGTDMSRYSALDSIAAAAESCVR